MLTKRLVVNMKFGMTSKKNAAAVALGRLGGKARLRTMTEEERSAIASKAGKTRAKKQSAEERAAQARKAAKARWAKKK